MNDYWNGIYGQESIKEILNRFIDSSKIPHAFLFSGIEGVGKDFVAIRFSQALNKKFLDSEKSSQVNNLISNFSEPYIKYIFPLPRGKNETDNSGPTEKLDPDEIQLLQDELKLKAANPYHKIFLPKASIIKINSIRDIKKFLSLEYSDISYRIVLISDAHLMNDASQNALLKSLEEPPSGVIFILTTPFPALLRETIRSRCWELNFQPLGKTEIKDILIEYFNTEHNLAGKIAPFANGSIRPALRLIDHDFETLLEKTISILRYSFGRKFNSALDQFNQFLSDGDSNSIQLIISLIIIWLNDLQKLRFDMKDYYYSDYIITLEKFNNKFPNIQLNNIAYKLENLAAIIQNNVNLNLIVLNIVYELSILTSQNLHE